METNKIYLGDRLGLIKELEDNSVDCVFTSPPYNRIRNDTYEFYDDTKEDYYSFLCDITNECIRVCKENIIVNIQMNLFNKLELCKWVGEFAENMKGIIVWAKNNPQPATNFKDGTYSITNAYENFYVLSGNGDLEFRANNKIHNLFSTNVNSEHFEGHGAIMRLDVAEYFIQNFSKKNDIVLDPFMGMGTTAIASAKHHRKYIGFELVAEYKSRAEKRISEEITQKSIFDFL